MAVGDVKSNERGSGARYNDGKPPFELAPVRDLAEYYKRLNLVSDGEMNRAQRCLEHLADWQEGCSVNAIYAAMHSLGDEAWEEAMYVLEYGKRKYAAWNWAKGMPWSVALACAVRHCRKILSGEDIDDESGRRHVGHVMCNLIFLATFMRNYPEGDDRPVGVLEVKRAA